MKIKIQSSHLVCAQQAASCASWHEPTLVGKKRLWWSCYAR